MVSGISAKTCVHQSKRSPKTKKIYDIMHQAKRGHNLTSGNRNLLQNVRPEL